MVVKNHKEGEMYAFFYQEKAKELLLLMAKKHYNVTFPTCGWFESLLKAPPSLFFIADFND